MAVVHTTDSSCVFQALPSRPSFLLFVLEAGAAGSCSPVENAVVTFDFLLYRTGTSVQLFGALAAKRVERVFSRAWTCLDGTTERTRTVLPRKNMMGFFKVVVCPLWRMV